MRSLPALAFSIALAGLATSAGVWCVGDARAAGPIAAGSTAATPAARGSSAATLYALNCMGCHPAPKTREHDAGPLRGEFFHSDQGRNFFIRMPAGERRLSAAEDARLLEEVLVWKRACAAIRQDAPMVDYRGERFVR